MARKHALTHTHKKKCSNDD